MMSEGVSPSGQYILLRHSLTNVLSNSARKWCRTHERTGERARWTSQGPFCALPADRVRPRRLGSLGRQSTRDLHARARDIAIFARSIINLEGRSKMPPFVSFFVLFQPVSTSCRPRRPRKVGKYFLPFPTTTRTTSTFRQNREKERERERERAVSITPSSFLPLR